MTEEVKQELKPRYSLGKITNKYLIIDIYAASYHTIDEVAYRMFMHNR